MIDDIRAARGAALERSPRRRHSTTSSASTRTLLGKRGTLIGLKSSLGALSGPEERKAAGRALNEATRR